jgi:hypothetical protein
MSVRLYQCHHTKDRDHCQTNRAHKPVIGANGQLTDHERVHGAAGHIASKPERALLIGCERQHCSLSGIRLYRKIIAIDIQAMDDIRADELYCYRVARVDSKLRWGVRKLPRVDPKASFLRREDGDREWSESYYQSSRC